MLHQAHLQIPEPASRHLIKWRSSIGIKYLEHESYLTRKFSPSKNFPSQVCTVILFILLLSSLMNIFGLWMVEIWIENFEQCCYNSEDLIFLILLHELCKMFYLQAFWQLKKLSILMDSLSLFAEIMLPISSRYFLYRLLQLRKTLMMYYLFHYIPYII